MKKNICTNISNSHITLNEPSFNKPAGTFVINKTAKDVGR